jgi:glycosyltransferase involved in cell wall biosynthesis
MGYDVTVLTGNPNYPQGTFYKGYPWRLKFKYEQYHGVNVIRMPIFARGKHKLSLIINYLSIWFWGHIFVLFTKRIFDLVITYGLSPIFQTSIGLHYAKKFKVPSWLYLMDFWPFSIEAVDGLRSKVILSWIGKVSYRIYRRSDKILISSLGYEQDLIDVGVPKQNIYYWPQYHEDFYQPLKKDMKLTPEIKDDDSFKLIFTGNIGYGQGIKEFIEYIKVEKNNLQSLNVKFYFIGEGRAKSELVQETKNYSLETLITFIPGRSALEIPQYLANVDAALLLIKNNPYLTKVLPAKVASYAGCNIRIFCVSDGPLAEFIESHKIGFSSYSFDPNLITSTLQKIVTELPTNNANLSRNSDIFNASSLMNQLEQDLLRPLWNNK